MNPDDHVCLCFRVSRRKLVNWTRINRPKVASLLSECGGAGTGCGWCVPFLKQIFRQASDLPPAVEPALEVLSAEDYARGRSAHIAAGRGTPPPDAALA